MKRVRRSVWGGVLAAAVVLAQSGVSQGAGLYVSVSGGANNRQNADDELAEARFERGCLWSVAVGTYLGSAGEAMRNARLELEYSKQYNNLDTLFLHPTPTVQREEKADGAINHESVLGMFYYDIPLSAKVKPYIGLGLGFGRSILDKLATPTLVTYGGAPGSYPLSTTTGWEMAYSLRAGLGWQFSDSMGMFIGGRYHKVREVVVESPANMTEVAAGQTANNATHPPVEMWIGEMGLRYTFF